MPQPSSGVVPAVDHNPTPPAPPAGHEPFVPEDLQALIKELNAVRNERSQLFAERIKIGKSVEKGTYKSDVEADWERHNRDRILDDKEESLMTQIRMKMHLLPPEKRPTMGLSMVVPF